MPPYTKSFLAPRKASGAPQLHYVGVNVSARFVILNFGTGERILFVAHLAQMMNFTKMGDVRNIKEALSSGYRIENQSSN